MCHLDEIESNAVFKTFVENLFEEKFSAIKTEIKDIMLHPLT